MRSVWYCVATGILWTLVGTAAAQTAGMLSFQGLLKDAGGVPISGPVGLTFSIYDAESGGALQGGPYGPVNVQPVNGVVSTKFGPVLPGIFDGNGRWLEITVESGGGPSVLPRIEIVTAAATAEQLNRPGTATPALIVDSDGTLNLGQPTRLQVARDGTTGIFVQGPFPNTALSISSADDPSAPALRIRHEGRSGPQGSQNFSVDAAYPHPNGWNDGPRVSLIRLSGDTIALGTAEDGTSLGQVGIGTMDAIAKLHVHREDGDPEREGEGCIWLSGDFNDGKLSLGVNNDGSFLQSHENKPLLINPLAENVGVGTTLRVPAIRSERLSREVESLGSGEVKSIAKEFHQA